MSSKNFGLAVAGCFIIASILVGGMVGNPASARKLFVSDKKSGAATTRVEEAYHEALSTVENNYVDSVDYEKASQAAIQGMLSTLDPHSNFFSKSEFARLQQDQESRFIGIGVNIMRHRDGVYVKSPVEGTPAARAGLRFGDRITEVDGKDAREWSTQQVSNAVRGPRGERVKLTIERAGASVPLSFNIVRDSVPLPSIRTAYLVRPGTGYIALSGGFNHTTSDEIKEAMESLAKEGMRQLVLDLRNNPGGLLDQAIGVASQFLERGQTVVSVRGRDDEKQKIYKNVSTDPVDYPLVVLINRNSASASEIVAGAVQDHGRGLVVGETSFGKGLVQRVFPLPFGAGLTLTTAHYYTPYGRLIQRDYSNGSFYDYYVRHDADDDEPTPPLPGSPTHPALPNEPVNTVPGLTPSPTPSPTPQGPPIKTAAGRVFYGGGGITPDIEAKPLDLALPVRGAIFEASFYFTRQLAAGIIPGLENYHVTEPAYGRHPRATDFAITDRVLEAFRNFVRRDTESKLTLAQINADIDYVKLRLRDDIVTAAFGSEAGSRVLLEGDPQLLGALAAFPEAKRLAGNVSRGS